MFNYSNLLESLHESRSPRPRAKITLPSSFCLPDRLPSQAFISREAAYLAPKAEVRLLRRSPSPPDTGSPTTPTSAPTETTEADVPSPERSPSLSTRIRTFSLDGLIKRPQRQVPTAKSLWRDPQPFEVFRAIEQKDIMLLMEIRDRAFHLLLRKSGDATPLVHAMRIGNSHRDVAILLVGALSRWVNHLEAEDLQKPQNKVLLKALRTNLKLAIDYGLQQSQSDLIASFLQTLIMSEGEKWVWTQVANISLSLRAGPGGEPVQAAETAVRAFATKELGRADAIAALEDYISNATADILMMAAWSCVRDNVPADAIPPYFFARDDRVYNHFVQMVHTHRSAILRTASKRLKWQLRLLEKVLGGRTQTFRQKVMLLREELDSESAV